MTKQLRKLFLLLLILATALPVAAQMHRVTTVNPSTKQPYTEVYEFENVDIQPQFPGGERGLINFVNETRVYPYNAYVNGIEGRVLCSFIVGANGKVSDVRILRGAGNESLNREAVRVISKMPKWKAGKIGNKSVSVRVVMPIAFRL